MKQTIVKKISEKKHISISEAEHCFMKYSKDFADDVFYIEFCGVLVYGLGLTIKEVEYIHNYLKAI